MAEDKKKTAEDAKVEKTKTRKAMTTTKKVKVIGKEQYINAETGEVEVMNVVSVEDRDFNFHKLWLGHILNSIDLIGNQKTRLAFWILDNLDSENKLIYTYEQIRKETGISSKTIADTFKALASSNFLKKKQSGVWIVNPDFIYKGSRNGRLNVLIQYRDAVREEAVKAKAKADKAESETTSDTSTTESTDTATSDTTVADTEVTEEIKMSA